MPKPSNPLASEIERRNRLAQSAWDLYTGHRQMVTRLIAACGPGTSVCVLGAGNLNDLDLKIVAESFEAVHLVDLDGDALRHGVERQQVDCDAKCVLHERVDAAGALDQLAKWNSTTTIGDAQLATMREAPTPKLPGPFDAVASTGLLTQLIDTVVLALGAQHPRLLDAIAAVRHRHLRLLLELLSPGKSAVLVTEIVSSDTFPQLPLLAESDLPPAVADEIARHNFFTGVNPAVIKSLFETDPALAPLVGAIEATLPWRWQFTERMYAVCAFRITRR